MILMSVHECVAHLLIFYWSMVDKDSLTFCMLSLPNLGILMLRWVCICWLMVALLCVSG